MEELSVTWGQFIQGIEAAAFGGVIWYFKRQIDRQTKLLTATHDSVTKLKAEHDTYKELSGCPLMELAKENVENG